MQHVARVTHADLCCMRLHRVSMWKIPERIIAHDRNSLLNRMRWMDVVMRFYALTLRRNLLMSPSFNFFSHRSPLTAHRENGSFRCSPKFSCFAIAGGSIIWNLQTSLVASDGNRNMVFLFCMFFGFFSLFRSIVWPSLHSWAHLNVMIDSFIAPIHSNRLLKY